MTLNYIKYSKRLFLITLSFSIVFFVNFLFSVSLKASSNYDVIIPNYLQINIQGKSLKKYATDLTNIDVDKTGLIHSDYKNSFKITGKKQLCDQTPNHFFPL